MKGAIVIFTDASESVVKKLSLKGCPVTIMNVRWATQWKGWERAVFLPWSLSESEKYSELHDKANLRLFVRTQTIEELERRVCDFLSKS